MFRALLVAGGRWAVALAVIGAVNSVIALFYYADVAQEMWMKPVPDGDVTPIRVPPSLVAALAITAVVDAADRCAARQPSLRFGDLAIARRRLPEP